jgi:3-dehydroquinate dehydratase-2
MKRLIYVINGPNLNLLGKRQPQIYGTETLQNVQDKMSLKVNKSHLQLQFFQSNHEGVIIDLIHQAREQANGIIINPGALSHTSIAILDALNTFDSPVLEVHLSNIHKRESFRHHSWVSSRAEGVIAGFGSLGYLMALDYFLQIKSAT